MKINYIVGDDGDVEIICKHGVGHSDNVHTCDGCCSKGHEILTTERKAKLKEGIENGKRNKANKRC